jgi:hypothetical protein
LLNFFAVEVSRAGGDDPFHVLDVAWPMSTGIPTKASSNSNAGTRPFLVRASSSSATLT